MPLRALTLSLAVICLYPHAALAQQGTYAVMSLAGDQLAVHAVRPDVGNRVGGTTVHVLPVAQQDLDQAVLLSVDAAFKRAGTTAVLMMSQDRELYKAANAMFEQPQANAENRAYLKSLLTQRKVSHLVLVTRSRDNAPLKLSRQTSVANGTLEGLGFYIDDTARLQANQTAESYFGMVVPFAYLKVRVIDAATLAVVHEQRTTFSFPIVQPSTQPSGMAVWTDMKAEEKLAHIRRAVDGAIEGTMPALLRIN